MNNYHAWFSQKGWQDWVKAVGGQQQPTYYQTLTGKWVQASAVGASPNFFYPYPDKIYLGEIDTHSYKYAS